MTLKFLCNGCSQEIEADLSLAGSSSACPFCGVPVKVPDEALAPGIMLGGFQLRKRVGAGAMGQIFLARQITMDRDVALKILPRKLLADQVQLDRFLAEIRILAKLEHPNIVTAFDAGFESGFYFLAMSYVDGKDLDSQLKQSICMAEKRVIQVAIKVAKALSYAWDTLELLHRDIKPSNIMIDRGKEVKLLDLGIAKSLKANLAVDESDKPIGTPHYMSPERFSSPQSVDVRADIYSLGVTLYQLVTGSLPYNADTVRGLYEKHTKAPFPNPRERKPNITIPFTHMLEVMMAKDPDQRYQNWEELITDIYRVGLGQTPEVPLPPDSTTAKIDPRAAKTATKSGIFQRMFGKKK